jgi:hypothetical protein
MVSGKGVAMINFSAGFCVSLLVLASMSGILVAMSDFSAGFFVVKPVITRVHE